MLLTSTMPGNFGVGEIYLRDLVETVPKERIACFGIVNYSQPYGPGANGVATQTVAFHRRHAWRPFSGKIGSLTSFLAFQKARLITARRIASEACEFARKEKAEAIWAVLDSPMVYRVASLVACRLQLPLISHVWDPPSGVCRALKMDSVSSNIAKRDFNSVMRKASCCAATSDAMAEEYSAEFGIPCVVLQYASQAQSLLSSEPQNVPSKQFIIGFCGSLYASSEWEGLLRALDSVKWRVADREVVIRVIGSEIQARSTSCARIDFMGWRNHDDLAKLVAECDVGYVPYQFTPEFQESVRLCFPTKLGTYLGCGIPVFFHGPRESSVVRFITEFPAGICCHSLDATEIVSQLSRFTDNDTWHAMRNAGIKAVHERLNHDTFVHKFHQLLQTVGRGVSSVPL